MAPSSSSHGERSERTLVGAAAAGTTAADDPPPAPKPANHADRKFRLSGDEPLSDGIRRVARGRLADSADAFAAAGSRAELGDAAHATRKAIKRVRTTLRLSRDALGERAYQSEKAEMKLIAGRLSDARDAQVLVETLAALEERFEDELPPFASAGLRARLEQDHERAAAELAADGDLGVLTREALEQACARTATWTFAVDDFGLVEPGLRRVYRQGRKRMRTAREEPTAEHLHDCRKRVKDLWHAAQLLRPAAPKRMKRLARDAHALSDLLGDHHDLSVLRDYIEVHPQAFDAAGPRDALLAVLDRRRDTLARRALKLGRRVYKRPPKRFVARIARGWRKRAGSGAALAN